MGERELRVKYGGKLDKAINRAIRAEVPGGNEALDRLTQLAGPARHSHWKDAAGRDTPEAAAYFKHKKDVVDRMDADVRRRWGVPPDKGGKSDPRGKSNRGGKAGKERRKSSPAVSAPSRRAVSGGGAGKQRRKSSP